MEVDAKARQLLLLDSLAVRAQVNIEPGTELSMTLTLAVTKCVSVGY